MILLHFFTTCALGLDFRLPFSHFLRTFFLSFSLVCLGKGCVWWLLQPTRTLRILLYYTVSSSFPSSRSSETELSFILNTNQNEPPCAKRASYKSDFICTFLHYPRTVKNRMFNLYKPCTHRQRENCAVHTYYSNETILFFPPIVFLSAAV